MLPLLFSAAIIRTNDATEPFHPTSGNHIHYMQHKFYDLYFFNATQNDTLLEGIKLTNNLNATVQRNLSNVDDAPEIRIDLPWDFKFYGHLHNWISVSPNGFLTTHPVTCWTFCNWWYSDSSYRRYMAPLMADFNPSQSDYAQILYYIDNQNQSLHVQWHNVSLWQPSSSTPLGYNYDFQIQLNADGTIYFYYFNVPKAPDHIGIPSYNTMNYTVNIGLEDAAYKHNDDGLYYLYPYSPVRVNVSHALNHQVVVFQPKETCIDQISCTECQSLATDPGSNLQCGWCPALGLCSDGMGREIYEYTSHEYCTEDEMLNHLVSETCTDYVSDTRVCNENDHVLARYPMEMVQSGISRFYSGVIIDSDTDSNTFLIQYDNRSIADSMVQYSWVYPCSTVSFDYSSFELPPRCVPHCKSIILNHTIATTAPSDNIKKAKSEALITSICIIVAVVVVICACVQFFLYRGRQRQRHLEETQNILVNQTTRLGFESVDDHEEPQEDIDLDVSLNLPSVTSGANSDSIDMNEEDLNEVSHPVISVPDSVMNSNRASVDAADVEIQQVGQIELVEHQDIDKNANTKGWDMTPLT
eukprot:117666_1